MFGPSRTTAAEVSYGRVVLATLGFLVSVWALAPIPAQAALLCKPVDVEAHLAQSKLPVGKRITVDQCDEYLAAASVSELVYDDPKKTRELHDLLGDRVKQLKKTQDWSELVPEGEARDSAIAKAEKADFAAGIYDTGEKVYVAFRGTDSKKDWIGTNLQRAMGKWPSQYSLACNLALSIRDTYPDRDIVFTGHSLGGGLAVHAADCVNGEAIVFNSDGQTNEQLSSSERNSTKIKNIYTPNDPLHVPVNMDGDDSLTKFIQGRLRQRGDLTWVPHTESCLSTTHTPGAGLATGIGPVSIGITAVNAVERARDAIDEHLFYNHAMKTMIQNLKACADSYGAGTPAAGDASLSGTGEDSTGNGANTGGKLNKAPKIKYNCQFSNC